MNERYYTNLGSCFYAVAHINHDNAALAYENTIVTYDQLNRVSNQIARFLLSKDIAPGDVVGIFNTKQITGYASMLACLKIGAIYTNIDEENPPERLKKILNTCEPTLLISDHHPSDVISATTSELKVNVYNLSSTRQYDYLADDNIDSTQYIIGSNPAYIMFTSGSTGIPKGVLISHQNILSFLGWSIARYHITPTDRFTQVSPMYFDNSVFDFYTALFSGASLAPINRETTRNPLELVRLTDTLKCTIWFSVPSLLVYLLTMKVLTRENMASIRIFTFGGEGFPKGELKKLYTLYSSQARFINVYGPTEGTCICSSYDITPADFNDMNSLAPLGPINPNFEYLIVDEGMNPVSRGRKGELCLVGPNVGIGYYNDKERTKQAFVQNPNITAYRDIIYRTGDLVYEKDDLLYFAGRADNQIKHMGYRIELEEIEAALNGLTYVNQSVVIYKRTKSSYGQIIAFISTRKSINEATVKKDLYRSLPEYMIPNIVEIRSALPKNANGKVDRKALLEQT